MTVVSGRCDSGNSGGINRGGDSGGNGGSGEEQQQ